jgi:hypothetical protein
MGSIIAFVIATGLGGSLLYFLADAQTVLRGCHRMGGERTESPWGDYPFIAEEMRRTTKASPGGEADKVARRCTGTGQSHNQIPDIARWEQPL